MRIFKRLLMIVAVLTAFASLSAGTALASDVLPASAHPHGWSLTRMTSAIALFNTSGNNAAYYPATPFQILYTGPSGFTVRPGTSFFVPLFWVDDSVPVLGTWPATHEDAISYFFDPAQLGGKGFVITVDGRSTPIRHAYLAGPVTTPPLLDCSEPASCGTHMIVLGAFMHPLTPGSHSVRIQGGVYGDDVIAVYGGPIVEDITYPVTVR
ncbi:MAG TPA: hypothetical protein VMU39_29420 [Solirubrobacteraceae bacterium]|nr:hypothetical protein [Solirubrobacteraceae bacterium]